MASVRPLREVLADLVGDGAARAGGPEAYLAEQGHADLPTDLVAEAVVSFADTAPPEVAEQLAPFVTAHTAGQEDAGGWFDLLTTASTEVTDDLDDLDGAVSEPWAADFGPDPDASLDFGSGAEVDLSAMDAVDETPAPATPTDWASDAEEPQPTEAPVPDPASQDVVDEDLAADEDWDSLD
jgi:hypothetical protein